MTALSVRCFGVWAGLFFRIIRVSFFGAEWESDEIVVLLSEQKARGVVMPGREGLWFSVCYKASCGVSMGVYKHKNPNTLIYGRTVHQ